MLRNKTFAVIGGDMRQVYLAGLLSNDDGYSVLAVGFDRDIVLAPKVMRCKSATEAVQKAGCVILPLPFTVDGITVNAPYARTPLPLEEIWGAAESDTLITGGKLTEKVWDISRRHGFKLVDYYDREELEVLNTIPTAEGAIQIAMEELPITIHNAKCLVMGYGRVSKMLCHDLKALGAQVTACARKYADLAWIKAMGYNAVHITNLPAVIGGFDVVFNTVPAVILTESVLSNLRKDCLVIDLASKPGGVDFETAGHLGLKTVWALSLPGKVAPITSGEIIKDTIINIISEEV
ncbi:MAG TPA: dipicolinate synthase subunit DpsA [Clostridia bacterium]|nr:dipicolinate synthase subunit DpsA [Clostridia bacterium]